MKLSTLVIPALAANVYSQTISLSNTKFDVSPCASPQGVSSCYQKADDQLTTAFGLCNGTSDANGCRFGAEVVYNQAVLGCMTEGCWNQAFTCEYQLMSSTYIVEIINQASDPAGFPPFWTNSTPPGACVCNLPSASTEILVGIATQCSKNPNADVVSCNCCAQAQRLAALQTICPNNTLEALGENEFVRSMTQQSSSCPGLGDSNWLDEYEAGCPNQGIQPYGSIGFINPLSIPAGFPPTAALSNTPGSITALSQLNITTSILTYTWNSIATSTYTFSSFNAAAATPASGGGSAQVTTLPGSTTTINGQATTLAGSVVTTSASKSGGVGKETVPTGLIAAVAVMVML